MKDTIAYWTRNMQLRIRESSTSCNLVPRASNVTTSEWGKSTFKIWIEIQVDYGKSFFPPDRWQDRPSPHINPSKNTQACALLWTWRRTNQVHASQPLRILLTVFKNVINY